MVEAATAKSLRDITTTEKFLSDNGIAFKVRQQYPVHLSFNEYIDCEA